MKLKKIISLLLSITILIGISTAAFASNQNVDLAEISQQTEENDIYGVISTGIGSAEAYLKENLTEIHNNTGVAYGSDWSVITLLRGGKTVDSDILDEYYDSLKETVASWDANVKPTNAAKVALALTVMDKDITDVEGVNLIDIICNSERLSNGANELAYSLLALYASNAEIPEEATWSKSDIITELLTFQTENGGFGLYDAETADIDITAMCIQALAPYEDDDIVAAAIDSAVGFLGDNISEDWDYDDNPNATAQVLLALASLGIDVTNPDNGFGNDAQENIVTALENYRNTDGNGYSYNSSVNLMATYQVMQAYDAYRKIHLDNVSYWDFTTEGRIYTDLAGTDEPDYEEIAAEPVDIFVTIVDNGDIVIDKNGEYVAQAQVTVCDLDRNGILTVDEALYATHEVLYDGGAEAGYSTFVGDHGLSLEFLWGRGNEGLSASAGYYLNNKSCWSLNDVVAEGDYLTAFNYYDAEFYSDAYSYFSKNGVKVKQGSSATLTLNALGYDENWNQVASPYVGANVKLLGTDGEAYTTNEKGKVKIKTSELEIGTYYVIAYTETKSIVPAVCKITVNERTGGGSVATEKLRITVKIMVHGDDCENGYTYKNDAKNFNALVSASVYLDKNETVYDALSEVLRNERIDFTEENGYVSEIGEYAEFDHGPCSGWLFMVDGEHKNTGCRETKLTEDCTVIWYYTDDYRYERDSIADNGEDDAKTDESKDVHVEDNNVTCKILASFEKTISDICEYLIRRNFYEIYKKI